MERVDIQGVRHVLSLPQSIAADGPIRIRASRFLQKQPARNVALIFMPDSGSFIRVETDGNGVAELPVPEQDGVLRIDGPVPELLNIKIAR